MATFRPTADLAIYGIHGAFWAAFGITRAIRGVQEPEALALPAGGAASPATARFARLLVAVHGIGFGVMYFGIGNAVFGTGVPRWFAGQQIAGTAIISCGAGLMCWALLHFRSWRFQARIESDHQLATGGPFALMRHPIYAGLDLLALGSAVWIPTPVMWAAVILMLLGADIRARAEETVLKAAFGDAYRQYAARTRRFVPGVY